MRIVYFEVLISLSINRVWVSSDVSSATFDVVSGFWATLTILSGKFSAKRFRVVQRRQAERPLSPILSRLRRPTHRRQVSNMLHRQRRSKTSFEHATPTTTIEDKCRTCYTDHNIKLKTWLCTFTLSVKTFSGQFLFWLEYFIPYQQTTILDLTPLLTTLIHYITENISHLCKVIKRQILFFFSQSQKLTFRFDTSPTTKAFVESEEDVVTQTQNYLLAALLLHIIFDNNIDRVNKGRNIVVISRLR